MNKNRFLFFFCIFVLIAYFIFGFFFLNIPPVKADDLWEISRAHFLIKHHHQGDPMFANEISPYMTSLFNATEGSKYLGILKTASQAFFIYLLPIDDIYAFRLTSFAWSLLACFLTYTLAIKTGLNKKVALFSAVLLIAAPEFFSQLHSQRPELMITAAYLAGILFFIYTIEQENLWKKRLLLFLSGIYAWVAVIIIHPNAIMIPATLGCIYLLREYKNFFSISTLLFSISMLVGFFYFYHLMQAPAAKAMMEGGGNPLDVAAPPVVRRGFSFIFTLPLVFYKKLSGINSFTKPGSLIFFLGACFSVYYLFKKKKTSPVYSYFDILCTGIIIPLIVLPLFSASNGRYNIIIFPLCALLIAAAIHEFSISRPGKAGLIHIFTAILCIIFLTNFSGMQKQREYTKEFQHIRNEIKKTITDNASTIIGNGLYYLDFKDQRYYSNAGMNPRIGRPGQSFEEAVDAVHANYLIIDDGLVYRIYRGRGKAWTDSMFIYLNKNCELINEINANYWIGHSAAPEAYPPQWRYERQQKNFIRKIKIYKVLRS
jgi:hypothetical protein